jgi:uncharacterized membrane protein YgcG
MEYLYLLIPAAFILILAVIIWAATYTRRLKSRRREFIEQYRFPATLRAKILFKHPDLGENQMFHVLEGLRQFFLICLAANAVNKKRSFGMPSKVVDDAWHEFILMSREYSRFCKEAFGGYLHHTPAGASNEPEEKALIRTLHQLKTKSGGAAGWAMLGGIPLLFAIDRAMAVEGGHHYDAAAMDELEQKRQHSLQNNTDFSFELGHDSSDGGSGGADGGGGCSGGGGCGGGCGS